MTFQPTPSSEILSISVATPIAICLYLCRKCVRSDILPVCVEHWLESRQNAWSFYKFTMCWSELHVLCLLTVNHGHKKWSQFRLENHRDISCVECFMLDWVVRCSEWIVPIAIQYMYSCIQNKACHLILMCLLRTLRFPITVELIINEQTPGNSWIWLQSVWTLL
jgi:hypothetical protein